MNKFVVIFVTLLFAINTYSQEPPQEFMADNGVEYQVIENELEDVPGKVVVKSFYYAEGEVIIPDILEYEDYYYDDDYNEVWYSLHFQVVEISEGAALNNKKINKVSIPATVTSIGNWAFSGCNNLVEVELSEGLQSIGNSAFGDCGFEEINLPNSIKQIGEVAFSGCKSLKSITWPATITKIPRMAFLSCENLTSVSLPDNLEVIEHQAFGYCGIKSIQLPQSLIEIEKNAFSYCESLETVSIPKNVSSIGSYENWYYLDSEEETFWETTYGNPFKGCSSLREIKVDEDNTYYDSRKNCNAIIETATNTIVSGCKNTSIPEDVPYLGGESFAGMKEMTKMVLPQTITRIAPSAFLHCEQLQSVDIPSGLKVIMYDTFRYCSSMKSVVIPEGIINIKSGAFADCESLEKITIPSTVEEIQNCAFSGYGYERDEMSQVSINLKEIYCHLQHPFEIDEGVFTYRHTTNQQWPYDRYDIFDNAKLFVPAGSSTEYKETAGWSRFVNIYELADFIETAIDDVVADDAKVVDTYLPDGRKAAGVSDGIRIVRMNSGQVRKVMK